MCLRAKLSLSLSLIWLLVVSASDAQQSLPTEFDIKAAMIFNFAKFVQWPPAAFAGPDSPIILGILGETPLGEALDRAVQGKLIETHPLVVRTFGSAAEARSCHVLFISDSEKARLPEVFSALRGTSVLTVAEMDHFAETGGMINFQRQGTKLRFQVNEAVAKNAGLKLSSKLLSLAIR